MLEGVGVEVEARFSARGSSREGDGAWQTLMLPLACGQLRAT